MSKARRAWKTARTRRRPPCPPNDPVLGGLSAILLFIRDIRRLQNALETKLLHHLYDVDQHLWYTALDTWSFGQISPIRKIRVSLSYQCSNVRILANPTRRAQGRQLGNRLLRLGFYRRFKPIVQLQQMVAALSALMSWPYRWVATSLPCSRASCRRVSSATVSMPPVPQAPSYSR